MISQKCNILTGFFGTLPKNKGAPKRTMVPRGAQSYLFTNFAADALQSGEDVVHHSVAFLNSKGAVRGPQYQGVSDGLFALRNLTAAVNIEQLQFLQQPAGVGADNLFDLCHRQLLVTGNGHVTGGSGELGQGMIFLLGAVGLKESISIQLSHIHPGINTKVGCRLRMDLAQNTHFLAVQHQLGAAAGMIGGLIFTGDILTAGDAQLGEKVFHRSLEGEEILFLSVHTQHHVGLLHRQLIRLSFFFTEP